MVRSRLGACCHPRRTHKADRILSRSHANLYFCCAQGFRTPAEVKRFQDMFDEMCHIVANKHGGSLKGEHGTGRNVASFVEMEWGARSVQCAWDGGTNRVCGGDVIGPRTHQPTARPPLQARRHWTSCGRSRACLTPTVC